MSSMQAGAVCCCDAYLEMNNSQSRKLCASESADAVIENASRDEINPFIRLAGLGLGSKKKLVSWSNKSRVVLPKRESDHACKGHCRGFRYSIFPRSFIVKEKYLVVGIEK
jgi:hypothetical protein